MRGSSCHYARARVATSTTPRNIRPKRYFLHMGIEVVAVRFGGLNDAVNAYAAVRDRPGVEPTWLRELGFVEHHHNGHLELRGTFAGHYVDFDEGDHVSETGAGRGAVVGALLGAMLGPPGITAGFALGGTIGSQTATPTEQESEPRALVEQLRGAVPKNGSAIVMIAETDDVDALLLALGDGATGDVMRQLLSAEQLRMLQTSLDSTPAASSGPTEAGGAAAPGTA
jgi:uncharacterized membrane protein